MVRERKVTPAELMDAAIARAEKHNPKLNAIVFKDYDRALAAARERKAGSAAVRRRADAAQGHHGRLRRDADAISLRIRPGQHRCGRTRK